MGVDLRLLPVEHLNQNDDGTFWGFAHTVLDVLRFRDAWLAIDRLWAECVPESANVSSWCVARVPDGYAAGERMYGRLPAKDAYGSPYTWIRAADLRPVFEKFFPGLPVTAYLNALNDDVKIILDWH